MKMAILDHQMKSCRRPSPILMFAVAAAIILLFSHHSAATKVNCRPPTAEDARLVAKTCSNLAVAPLFDCCRISRTFIFRCSNCATAAVTDRRLESKAILRVLDNAAKACNFNLSQVLVQELDCLGIKDWNVTPLRKDVS